MRGGLAWLDTESQRAIRQDVRRRDATPQRRQMLDDIAYPQKAPPGMSHGVAFFNRFRDMTASGFYSSAIGLEGSPVHRQRVQSRLRRLSARRARQARRELRRHDHPRESATAMSPQEDRSRSRGKRLGVGVHRQRIQRALPHAGVSRACATPTCSASGARTRRTPRRPRSSRATLDVGDAKPYASIAEMVADPAIDAIWLSGPNQARVENVEEIVDAVERGKGALAGHRLREAAGAQRRRGDAGPRAREARRHSRTATSRTRSSRRRSKPGAQLLWARGAATTGRPYLARAAEEHSGPHMPWFWRGELQGGGVLNDMMCHSALVVRHLLTKPGAPLSTVKPVRVTAHIASLKWTPPGVRRSSSRRRSGATWTTRRRPPRTSRARRSSSRPTTATP